MRARGDATKRQTFATSFRTKIPDEIKAPTYSRKSRFRIAAANARRSASPPVLLAFTPPIISLGCNKSSLNQETGKS